tara:strand:- start:1218 stop:1376 length:159 start_codon:yes stop_codon:yes gene_type:complete
MKPFKVGDLVVHIDDDEEVGIVICIDGDIAVLWADGEVMYHGSGYYLEAVCK